MRKADKFIWLQLRNHHAATLPKPHGLGTPGEGMAGRKLKGTDEWIKRRMKKIKLLHEAAGSTEAVQDIL